MVDKVRPLGLESSANGGSQTRFEPTEIDPTQDFVSAKGIALEASDNTVIQGSAGVMQFKDSQVTTLATLKDLALRLALKDVDVSALTEGYVLTWNNTLNKFELKPTGGSGTGVTPPFFFSRSGSTLAVNTYLLTGNVSTSSTGQFIAGTNKIVRIVASTSTNIAGTPCIIQFQRRTAVSTFVDISGASVSIPVGSFSATSAALAVNIGPDWELSCYYKSGGSPSNPVVGIYLTPQ